MRRRLRRLRELFPETTVVHDPRLDVFDRGCWALTRNGVLEGHVSSMLTYFRTPFEPFTKQDWIWLVVVWLDGTRSMPIEEYPPWHDVEDLLAGTFDAWTGQAWQTFEAKLLTSEERDRVWSEFNISEADM